MSESDFASLLLNNVPVGIEPDFIEVHIYGSLHRLNIERLLLQSGQKHERAILKQVKQALGSIGATVEEVA